MKKSTIKGYLIYLVLGLISVASLYPFVKAATESQLAQIDIEVALPIELLAILSLIQPLILLVVSMLIGFFLAHKVGLTSLIMQSEPFWPGMRKGLRLGILSGLAVGVFIVVSDLLMQPFLPDVFSGPIEAPQLYSLIYGMLYGGIAEELMMRWGLMTLIVFIIWKLFQRKQDEPSNSAYWGAIIISALLFALGHYGATAIMTDMTFMVLVRMIVLNGIGGVVFGWLYWKYNLETAIVSHMFAHVGMNSTILLLSFFF